MKNTLVKAVSLAAMTVGVAFAATPAQKASAQISGAGASSITPVVPTIRASGANYAITGSGRGRTELQAGRTQFASSDASGLGTPAPDLSLPGGQVSVNGFDINVVFPYNIPSVEGDITSAPVSLNLTVPQACGIIAGTITDWTDPALSPQLNLANDYGYLGNLPIKRVARGDSSGTTDTLNGTATTGFINQFCGGLANPIANPPATYQLDASGNQIPDASGQAILVTDQLQNPNSNDIIVRPFVNPLSSPNADNFVAYSQGVASTVAANIGAVGYVDSAVANGYTDVNFPSGLPVAVNVESGVSNLAVGPNYFIFRRTGNGANTAQLQALCNAVSPGGSIATAAINLGYLAPSGSSDNCSLIGN